MLILYSTSHCHLCEQAIEILNHFSQTHATQYQLIEITDDDTLLARYGTKIPVIKNINTGIEISWPFNVQDISRIYI